MRETNYKILGITLVFLAAIMGLVSSMTYGIIISHRLNNIIVTLGSTPDNLEISESVDVLKAKFPSIKVVRYDSK